VFFVVNCVKGGGVIGDHMNYKDNTKSTLTMVSVLHDSEEDEQTFLVQVHLYLILGFLLSLLFATILISHDRYEEQKARDKQ
jgi:hypothetical protein